MAVSKFDKLNVLSYEEYFDPMRISKKEKEIRLALAKALENVFRNFFLMIEAEIFLDEVMDLEYYSDFLYRHYISAAEPYSDYIPNEEVKEKTADIVKSTFKQIDNAKEEKVKDILSVERAVFDAANESNWIRNNAQIEEAKQNCYTKKEWLSMRDDRVRPTHVEVDGETIPIDSLFRVGNSFMEYPMDASHGASLEEIVGCRCTLEFHK